MEHLIVFLKNPVAGKVKTRLAATVGDEKALEIYLLLIDYTREICKNCKAEKNVFFSDFIDEKISFGNSFVQQGADLGEKMKNAFRTMFDSGAKKVVIIGTDCAELTTEILDEAFLHLNNHDFVIGPAHDGGYYLLGMKSFFPEIFDGVLWSTDAVFTKTKEKIISSGKSLFLLSVLRDIDTEENLFTMKKLNK